MDFDSSGWFKSALTETDRAYIPLGQAEHADEKVYQLANPWVVGNESVVKKKVVFHNVCCRHYAQGLICIYRNVQGEESDPVGCSGKIYSFLKSIYPDLSPSLSKWFSKQTDSFAATETFLSKRIAKLLTPSRSVVWDGFYNNAQLFVDFYLFRLYCFADNNTIISDYLRDQKDMLNFSMLSVIAGAAHANKEVASEETALFRLFLKHNFMSEERRKAANVFIEKGASLDQIRLPENDSWALKKFLLELAIATVWSDGILDEEEEKFINTFSRSLQLSDTDEVSSYIRIESLLISLISDNSLDKHLIERSFLKRINKLLSAYSNEIIHLLKSNTKVCMGLKHASIGKFNEKQKSQLAQNIINILQSMKIFRGISFNSLDWPYQQMLKILPKDVVRHVIS